MTGVRLSYPAAVSVRHGSRYDYPFWSDEGYGWIQSSREHLDLDAVSGWGVDGWDLGDWPYVIFSVTSDGLTVCQYVEGDLTWQSFADRGGASARLDAALMFHNSIVADELRATFDVSRRADSARPLFPRTVEDLPGRFRGRFSWHRLAQSKGETCGPGCRTCQRAVSS